MRDDCQSVSMLWSTHSTFPARESTKGRRGEHTGNRHGAPCSPRTPAPCSHTVLGVETSLRPNFSLRAGLWVMRPTYTCCLRYLLSEFRLRCTHVRPEGVTGGMQASCRPAHPSQHLTLPPKGFPSGEAVAKRLMRSSPHLHFPPSSSPPNPPLRGVRHWRHNTHVRFYHSSVPPSSRQARRLHRCTCS